MRESAPPRIYCRSCQYELTGALVPSCPECGLIFDPADRLTTLSAPISEWRRSPLVRVGLRLAVVMLIVAGFVHTILPRPARLNDWRHWVWMNMSFGVREQYLGSNLLRQHMWADRPYRTLVEAPGRTLWEIRVSSGEWKLRVHEPGVAYMDLVFVFNMMKREKFGILFTGADRALSSSPLECVGDQVAIMSLLIDHYGLRFDSFRLSNEQSYAWVYDKDKRSLVSVPIGRENIDQFPVRMEGGDRPMVVAPPAPTAEVESEEVE